MEKIEMIYVMRLYKRFSEEDVFPVSASFKQSKNKQKRIQMEQLLNFYESANKIFPRM
jgi:hypothetical protein